MSARSIGFGIIFRRFILSIQSKAVSSLVSSLGAHMAHTAAHKAHTAQESPRHFGADSELFK